MDIIHFAPNAAKGLGRKYETDDGFVIRPAEVFECGDYPDKGFSLSEAEADEAIREFQPAHNNVEHRPSVFDRLLGTTEGLFRKGKKLYANVKIPKAVDALLGDAPIPLSAEWTAEPKRYVGTALTVNPRILTAAAHAFTSSPDFKTFAAENPIEAAELVTEALKAPAPAPPMLTPQQIQEAAWTTFSADPANAGVTKETFMAAFATPQATPAPTPKEDPAIRAELDALAAKFGEIDGALAARSDADEALAFFRDELKAGRKTPADEAKVVAEIKFRREYDRLKAKSGNVAFSANSEGSKEKEYRDQCAADRVVFNWQGVLPSHADIPTPEGAEFALSANPWKDFDLKKHLGANK
jgi:hypothetical protein